MGWTVLYIAFGVVALWLLGEVLLQYKARLRWRLLAFAGFLGVVVGVLLPSVPVIVLGALAFAVGQTYVTLSFRRGFSTGWAIGGNPGASRRRRSGGSGRRGATLEVTELSYDGEGEGADGTGTPEAAGTARGGEPEVTAVYEPLPIPDETGQYAVYAPAGGGAHGDTGAYDPTAAYGAPGQDGLPGHGGYDGFPAEYPAQPAYDYGTGDGQQQYAAYSDPYIGPGTDAQQYAPYYGDPYAPSSAYDTPPGGVWVPQQRDTEPEPPQPHTPEAYGYEQQLPDDRSPYRY
ncbi:MULTISPECIES: hypothetical protein [unclassified Streptomyces]|uniref:hypothetical protein n=1 Tax=unclassified Streptomyces TaxID=2593676 RepID=UPI00367659A1